MATKHCAVNTLAANPETLKKMDERGLHMIPMTFREIITEGQVIHTQWNLLWKHKMAKHYPPQFESITDFQYKLLKTDGHGFHPWQVGKYMNLKTG